jgi:hypothetical protein
MRGRTLGVISILAIGLLAGSSSGTTAQDEEPSPAPSVTETVHGWPGIEHAPAGLYSWSVRPTSGWQRSNWMHKILADDTGDALNLVELNFHAGPLDDQPPIESHAIRRAWWLEDADLDRPTRVGDEVRTESWVLDVEDMRVLILLASYPDTDPALVDEARAVIESIVVEPTDSGQRLVFRLLEGWDSG